MSLWSYFKEKVSDAGNWIKDKGYVAGKWLWEDIAFPLIEEGFNLLGYNDEDVEYINMSTTRIMSDPSSQFLINAINSIIINEQDFTESVILQQRIGPVGALYTLASYSYTDFYFKQPTYNSSFLKVEPNLVTDILDDIVNGSYTVDYISYILPADLIYVLYNLQVEGWNSSDNVIIINSSNWFYSSYVKQPDNSFRIILAKFIVTVHNNITETIIYTEGTTEYTKITIYNELVITNGTPSETVTTRSYLSHTLTEQETDGSGSSDTTYVILNFVISDSSVTEYIYKAENIPAIPNVYHYVCEYTLNNDSSSIRYFVEETPSARYPTLVSAFIIKEYVDTKILPIIPIIRNNIFIEDEPDEIKDSVTRALDIIGLSLDTLSTDLKTNPDINVIEDSFIMYGVNIYTQKQSGLAALFLIFEVLEKNASISKNIFENYIATQNSETIRLSNITSYIEEAFNFQIIFNYIERKEITGVIGIKGTYSSTITWVAKDYLGGNIGEVINSYLVLRYQITDTTYISLKVHGLIGLLNLRTKADTFKTYQMVVAEENLDNIHDNFNIPLTASVFFEIDSHMQTELAYEALVLVTFSAQTVHLRFYQTDDFQLLMGVTLVIITFVLIVFTIATWGAGGFTAAALWAIAANVLIQASLYYAFTLTLDHVSSDNAELRALITGIYIVSSIYFGNKINNTELFNAENLLKLTTLTVNTVVSEFNYQLSIQTDLLRDESAQFDLDAEARQEEIDKAAELLGDPSKMSVLDINSYIEITANESPDEFYERTVGTLNPGIAIFYQMDNYADILTTLPKPKQH